MTNNLLESGSHRLEVIENQGEISETCETFVFHNEDHTLGNSLRYIIMKIPDVKFCGYSIPHPSENKINFRIQTYGKPAVDVLKKGLKDLNSACEHVLKTFEDCIRDHENNLIASATGELITHLICQLKDKHFLIQQIKIDHPFGRKKYVSEFKKRNTSTDMDSSR